MSETSAQRREPTRTPSCSARTAGVAQRIGAADQHREAEGGQQVRGGEQQQIAAEAAQPPDEHDAARRPRVERPHRRSRASGTSSALRTISDGLSAPRSRRAASARRAAHAARSRVERSSAPTFGSRRRSCVAHVREHDATLDSAAVRRACRERSRRRSRKAIGRAPVRARLASLDGVQVRRAPTCGRHVRDRWL